MKGRQSQIINYIKASFARLVLPIYLSPLSAQIDRDWYMRRYRDVADQEISPVVHFFRHGYSEGRFPNAESERQSFIAKEFGEHWQLKTPIGPPPGKPAAEDSGFFDPNWYMLRNLDLMTSGSSPWKHYATTGLIEGRSPNATMEPREGLGRPF